MTELDPGEPANSKPARTHLFEHGRLTYMQIPAVSVRDSAVFYKRVFGWQIRDGGTEEHLGFIDATGDMIGAWVTDLAILQEPAVLVYIYVHGIDAVL